MKTYLKFIIVTFLSVFFLGGGLFTQDSSFTLQAKGTLDYNEATHLAFMREEEKLARDVYITFSEFYPTAQVFFNITESEQRHTDAVLKVMGTFGLDDPNTNDDVGEFTGDEWGKYFTDTYKALVEQGKKGLLEALYVGALIEELDMHDIIFCPEEIVYSSPIIKDEFGCGQVYTKEESILTLYQNLLNGSGSHLRAYVYYIEKYIGEGNYEAQYLSQEEVDDILGR